MVVIKFPLEEFLLNTKEREVVNMEVPYDQSLQHEVGKPTPASTPSPVSVLDTIEFVKYSKDEIEAIKSLAVADGMQLAKSEYEQEQFKLQERNGELLNEIKAEILKLEPLITEQYKKVIENLGDLAGFLVRKIVGNIAQHFSKELIVDFLNSNLSTVYSEPSINIKLNSKDYEAISEHLDSLEKLVSPHSKINVLQSNDLALGDCVVDFEKGKISRDTGTLMAQLDSVLDNYFEKKAEV